MRTISILFIFLAISITNPFQEFDKSFLYDDSDKKVTRLNENTSNCINLIHSAKNQDDPLVEYLITNSSNICSCIFEEKSDHFINNLTNSLVDITLESWEQEWPNEKLKQEWHKYNNLDCLNIAEEEIVPLCEYGHGDFISILLYLLTSHPELSIKIDSALNQQNDTNSNKNSKKDQSDKKDKPTNSASKNKKVDKNAFEEKIKDYNKIEGLFTFYSNEDKNSVLMEIKPEQLETIYLASFTRQSGDAYWFDGSSMMGEFPIMFKKVGDKIQAIEVNVKFRADDNLAINKAVESHISNSLMSSTKIISNPHQETGAYLIDASNFFISDIGGLGRIKGGGFKFDKGNSYYNYIKSFPQNSEIDVSIHYISMNSKYKFTLPDSRSMIHKYHISLSSIPESNYKPRAVDDRVGHFMTMYQDYSNTYSESPYVRYVNRWNLQKKNPHLNLSEPIEPIVFWIENTVPHEFRDAVREGITKWNLAFEKIGFKNAIVAKQMPDDADWDPADTRYNTIRWMIQPGSAYAVGPSRANPFTGELYDADIRIGSDYLRFYYTDFIEFIEQF